LVTDKLFQEVFVLGLYICKKQNNSRTELLCEKKQDKTVALWIWCLLIIFPNFWGNVLSGVWAWGPRKRS